MAAFTPTSLIHIGHGNGQNVFLYKTVDTIAETIASGYFNTNYERFNKGDVIIAVTSTGGTIAVDVIVVSSASGAATVTTTNGT